MASRALEIPLTLSKRSLRQTVAIVDLGGSAKASVGQSNIRASSPTGHTTIDDKLEAREELNPSPRGATIRRTDQVHATKGRGPSSSGAIDSSAIDSGVEPSGFPRISANGIDCSVVNNALRKLDGLTLLEWCVRRLSESEMIDEIVITGPQQFRDKIRCTGLGDARWIPSAFKTPGERALEIAERFEAQWIVFASPLCPFTDPTLLDRLIATGWSNPESDIVEYLATNPNHRRCDSLGLVQAMCSIRTLEKLRDKGLLQESLDVPELWMRASDLFLTKYLPLPYELDTTDARFRVESIEDWDRATRVLEATGPDFCWRRLVDIANRLD